MATAFDQLAEKIPKGDMGPDSPQMIRDYLGAPSPGILSGQPALPTSAAPTPAAGPSGPSGIGAAGEKAATGLLAPPGGGGGDMLQSFPGSVGGSGGGSGGEGPGSPAVTGTGSFPQSFDLASLNLGNLGVTGTLAGVGGRIGPTGIASFTTGHGALDQALHLGANALGIPMSQNLVGALAGLVGSHALGALASFAGPLGFPIALAQLAHAISSNVSGTIASNINSVLSDPQLTPEMQAQFLAEIAQGFPMSGGPQSAIGPGNLGGLGPSGAAFGLDFSNPSVQQGFAAQSSPKGNAFEDIGPPAAPDATAPDTGPPGEASGTGAPGAGAASDSGDAGAPGDY